MSQDMSCIESSRLLGRRCLLKVETSHFVEEYKVLEISPSGNWIKLQNLNGNKFWKSVATVKFVEELKDIYIRPEER